MPAKYVSWKTMVWKHPGADRWHWRCNKPNCKTGSASHWRIAYFFAFRHTLRNHVYTP